MGRKLRRQLSTIPFTAASRVSGKTPYYGANGIQGYVEGYTHNGEYILIAEDGASDLKNYPIQYVSGEIWVNNHAHVLQGKQGISDNKFLMNAIRNTNIEPFLVGGGRAKLNAAVMMKINLSFPLIEEQSKIGDFFKQLDDTIALQQQELDTLKQTKQGFLQKMFPKEGKTVPEVRFEGFSGEWKEQKIENLVTSLDYGLNASAKSFDGENKYIRITDIDESSHKFIQSSLTSPDINLENANDYLLDEGDILFTRTGASVGKTYCYNLIDGKVYYAGFLIRARLKAEYDSYFVFQNTLTNKYNKFIKITSQRSGQPGVNAQEYGCFQLLLPSFEEQSKIGLFFKQLDDTIALHQQELEALKETKQAFLQKMFV
ncbi:restriction endonuclease subunit S [Brochothrix thermosphacta]|uniref:restriction endonuclease subunit S n=1 Tax=Brochothrix thermosphacta TaxID=2756 RepID=UPI001FD38698|nr:restriction endonuclease subunit S [Brochothrix thermosphacta]